MDYHLRDKIAIVTGTASQVGMGKAICLNLAKEGTNIVSVDIDLIGARETAATIESLGCKSIALMADVSKNYQVEEMVKNALTKFGKIDILINNAGLNAGGLTPFLDSKVETWERDLAVNLFGTMNCTKAVIPTMVEHKYGKIINISSAMAKNRRTRFLFCG